MIVLQNALPAELLVSATPSETVSAVNIVAPARRPRVALAKRLEPWNM